MYKSAEYNWRGIEVELNISERCDPEAILHEIAHAMDVEGDLESLVDCSTATVDRMLDEKYGKNDFSYSLSEVRATALTVLAMRTLGVSEEVKKASPRITSREVTIPCSTTCRIAKAITPVGLNVIRCT